MTELKKDDVIELDVTDVNNLGNGVGRVDSRVVFIRGAVSGERVKAKVIKTNKSFAVAKLIEVLTPSEHRLDKEFCQAPLSCGGCVYRHITYEHELLLKRGYVKAAFAKAGIGDATVLPVLSTGKTEGYRNKAQYPVARNRNGIFAGFYASKTHSVLPVGNCSIQNKSFSDIVKAVCEFADANGWSVYDEESGKGLLRHIYLRAGQKTGEIMLCLVINGERLPKEDSFVAYIVGRFNDIVSLMINKNTRSTNVVLGNEYRTLYGKDGIEDELCGLSFFISPDSFYQVNREGAEMLYTKAAQMADFSGTEVIMDLYCGTGTIGLSMAQRVKSVCGVEIVESAVECARENARRNGIDNARFVCADAGDKQTILDALDGARPDAVIIDPPRKGSTKELVNCLAELEVDKIVYISCDPDTLARDAVWFKERGYHMGEVQPVDMFPRTGHVECVVCFARHLDR